MSTIMYKIDENTGIEMLYRNKSIVDFPVLSSVADKFNHNADQLDLEKLCVDKEYSQEFNIPQHYKNIDIEEHMLSLVQTSQERERVEHELALFSARNLYPILQLLIYIVDTLRKHNIVWGVGRGSSVASYCLYLIGIHKINSIKYNLDIREFLK